jgi:hypothetical protein
MRTVLESTDIDPASEKQGGRGVNLLSRPPPPQPGHRQQRRDDARDDAAGDHQRPCPGGDQAGQEVHENEGEMDQEEVLPSSRAS